MTLEDHFYLISTIDQKLRKKRSEKFKKIFKATKTSYKDELVLCTDNGLIFLKLSKSEFDCGVGP